MSAFDLLNSAQTALVNPLALIGDIVKNLQKQAAPTGRGGAGGSGSPAVAKGVNADKYTTGGLAREKAGKAAKATPASVKDSTSPTQYAESPTGYGPPDENGVRKDITINTLDDLIRYNRIQREMKRENDFQDRRDAGKKSMQDQGAAFNAAQKDMEKIRARYVSQGMTQAEAHKKAVEDIKKKNGGILPSRVNTGTFISPNSMSQAMQTARFGADSYNLDNDILAYGAGPALLANEGMIDSRLRPDARGHFDPSRMDEAASLLRRMTTAQ